MNGKEVNTKTVIAAGRKKTHRFPKMSKEAQTVLQEIRAIDRQSCEMTTDNKSSELCFDLLFPKASSETDKKMSESDSSAQASATDRLHGCSRQGSSLVEEEFPFVITFPGFDIRYNLTALRPHRESPRERERNVCMQRKSVAKCKEWLKKC